MIELAFFSLPIQNLGFVGNNGDSGLNELFPGRVMKPDPGVDDDWVFSYGNGSEFEMSCVVPMAANCSPEVTSGGGETAAFRPEMLCFAVGMEGLKKRKADAIDDFKVVEERLPEKRMKGSAEELSIITSKKTSSKSTITSNRKEPSVAHSKDNSVVNDVPKTEYIHVRARRGQATDSHSLAERVRREKISERMKYLQDLVPGCNKIIGKAGLLDEIINYVQSLQRQVEFLSMKLAVINPRLDFDLDNLLAKKMPTACVSNVPGIGLSPDTINPLHFQFSSLSQGFSFCDLEMGLNRSDDTTISAPVSTQEALLDASCLNQIQSSNWDADLPNFFSLECQQQRSTSYVSPPFTGLVKQEM